MTTVCAIARAGRVVMGADSMTNIYERPLHGVRKILQVTIANPSANPGHADLLLGFAGDGPLPGRVQAHLTIDQVPLPDVSHQAWADTIACAITQIAVDHQLTESGRMDSNVILGYNGRLWTICHNQAMPNFDGVAAIGSGEGPAIGVIDYGISQGVTDFEELVNAAVHIASRRDKHTNNHELILSIP